MNKEYNEPNFKVVVCVAQDVLTASAQEEQTSPPNSGYTPGHYDTPIIKL